MLHIETWGLIRNWVKGAMTFTSVMSNNIDEINRKLQGQKMEIRGFLSKQMNKNLRLLWSCVTQTCFKVETEFKV